MGAEAGKMPCPLRPCEPAVGRGRRQRGQKSQEPHVPDPEYLDLESVPWLVENH